MIVSEDISNQAKKNGVLQSFSVHFGHMTNIGREQCLLQDTVILFSAFSPIWCLDHSEPSLAQKRRSTNICGISINCQKNGWRKIFRLWILDNSFAYVPYMGEESTGLGSDAHSKYLEHAPPPLQEEQPYQCISKENAESRRLS